MSPLLWIPMIDGLARVWADPAALEAGPAELVLVNPHLARSVLRVGDVEVGQVDPRHEVVVRNVREGDWAVTWVTPRGFERTETVRARLPARSSRSSSR